MSKYKDIVIACDMDDTIEYLVPAWIKWLNMQYNLNVKYIDVTDWDISKVFPTLTSHQIFEPLDNPEFWDTVKPMKDAQYYIPKLIEEGFQFYIVTSSHPRNYKYKYEKCLRKYFPYLSWKNIIVTKNKQLINCDILIDDGEHNIIGPYIGLLKDTTHNKNFNVDAYENITRVHCWKHIYEVIHKFYD